jgi:DNA polymerase-3 subunit gamma/tau
MGVRFRTTGTPSVPHRGAIGGGPQSPRQYDSAPRFEGGGATAPAPRYETAAAPQPAPQVFAAPKSYLELVALAGEKRDVLLKTALEQQMRPVAFREKSIEVALVEGADPGVIQALSRRLREWTGQIWGVSVSTKVASGPTMRDVREEFKAQAKSAATDDPLVKAILEMFPGSTVTVKLREEQVPDAAYEDAFMDEREDE